MMVFSSLVVTVIFSYRLVFRNCSQQCQIVCIGTSELIIVNAKPKCRILVTVALLSATSCRLYCPSSLVFQRTVCLLISSVKSCKPVLLALCRARNVWRIIPPVNLCCFIVEKSRRTFCLHVVTSPMQPFHHTLQKILVVILTDGIFVHVDAYLYRMCELCHWIVVVVENRLY